MHIYIYTMIYLKKNSFVEVYAEALRGGIRGRSYTKLLRGGLTRTCFSMGNACSGLVLRRSLTCRPYAELLGIFFRICHTRKVLREPFTEALHGGLTRSYFSVGNACNSLVLRGSLTQGPCAEIFQIDFFSNKIL